MKKTRFITQAAVIAAAYAALSLVFAPISFGAVQFRVSEVLTLLPLFTPAAIPGLFIGCIIANLASPFGIIDIVFGSLATLAASLLTYFIGKKVKGSVLSKLVAPLPPVILNAVVVGSVLSYMLANTPDAAPFYIFGAQVGLGEAGVCYILGVPLMLMLEKTGLTAKLFK